MMDRRTFAAAAATALGAACLSVRAQPLRPIRIGYLGNGSASTPSSSLDALRRGLRELGWIEGQRLHVEARWAEGNPSRLPALVDDLVRSKVDLLVVAGPPAIAAARQGAGDIPIVFVSLIDPVTMGFVRSLAHPGGSMTGLASHFEELVTKQLQLLKEAAPGIARVAFLRRPESATALLASAQNAARSLGLKAWAFEFSSEPDLDRAFRLALQERVGAMHVLPSPFLVGPMRARVIQLASRHRLLACYELRSYVVDGGLMSYGPLIDDMFWRAAAYVDRILQGARAGDLAIERPAKFELAINLKTARSMGLTLPGALVQRADELIQ